LQRSGFSMGATDVPVQLSDGRSGDICLGAIVSSKCVGLERLPTKSSQRNIPFAAEGAASGTIRFFAR